MRYDTHTAKCEKKPANPLGVCVFIEFGLCLDVYFFVSPTLRIWRTHINFGRDVVVVLNGRKFDDLSGMGRSVDLCALVVA